MNKWALRGSHPLGGAICQHGPVSRDASEEDNVWKERAGHPCLWLSDELWVLEPLQPSIWVRQEECLRVEWHLSLSLCPSTPSLIWAMKFPQKYMITQELSHLLSLIWPIFLSRLFSYISACIVSLVISFSLYTCCRISVLLQNLWCPETLRTSYIMCETDFFWSRRKTNRSDNDCLRDISGAGRISTGRLNKPVCLSVYFSCTIVFPWKLW